MAQSRGRCRHLTGAEKLAAAAAAAAAASTLYDIADIIIRLRPHSVCRPWSLSLSVSLLQNVYLRRRRRVCVHVGFANNLAVTVNNWNTTPFQLAATSLHVLSLYSIA